MYYYGQNYGYPGYNSNYMYPQTQSSYISWLVIAIIIFVILVIIAISSSKVLVLFLNNASLDISIVAYFKSFFTKLSKYFYHKLFFYKCLYY